MQSGQLSAAAESTDKPIIALDTDFTSDKTVLCRHRQRGGSQIRRLNCYEEGKVERRGQAAGCHPDRRTGRRDASKHVCAGYRSAVEQAGGTVLGALVLRRAARPCGSRDGGCQRRSIRRVWTRCSLPAMIWRLQPSRIWDNNSAAYQNRYLRL